MEGNGRGNSYTYTFLSCILFCTQRWGGGSGTGWVAVAEVVGNRGDAWHKVYSASSTVPISWHKADRSSLIQVPQHHSLWEPFSLVTCASTLSYGTQL